MQKNQGILAEKAKGFDKIKDRLWWPAAILVILFFCLSCAMGFRLPEDYILTTHVITPIGGFVPRTLVNTIYGFFVGENLYKRGTLSILILAIELLFVLYILGCIVETVAIRKNLFCFFLFLNYALSAYSKYFLHEAGYFEQYAYLLCLILIEAAVRCRWQTVCILASAFSLLACVICETDLFLVSPALFSLAFLEIIRLEDAVDTKKTVRRVLALCGGFSFSVIYSLMTHFILVPKERIDNILRICEEHVNFPMNMAVFDYFWRGRIFPEYGFSLRPIPSACVFYPLSLVLITFLVIWETDSEHRKRTAISYCTLCILTGLFVYSLEIIAFDFSRFYFSSYIQIFFITIYIAKRNLMDYKLNKTQILCNIFYLLNSAGLYTVWALPMFSNEVYFHGLIEFLTMLNLYPF